MLFLVAGIRQQQLGRSVRCFQSQNNALQMNDLLEVSEIWAWIPQLVLRDLTSCSPTGAEGFFCIHIGEAGIPQKV